MKRKAKKEEKRHPLAVICGKDYEFDDYVKVHHFGSGDAVRVATLDDSKGKRFRGVVTIGTYHWLENWAELFSSCSLK